MTLEELTAEMQMSYYDLQQYLLQKYGPAQYDFFHNEQCKSKNKRVRRTSEGLFCHHMDEDKGSCLCDPSQAAYQPFAWQKKERLVYCNILEHLVLHIKIAVLRQRKKFKKPIDITLFFTTGGIYQLCSEINTLYVENGTKVPWRQRCFTEIKDNYDLYVIVVQSLMSYIDRNYQGERIYHYKSATFAHLSTSSGLTYGYEWTALHTLKSLAKKYDDTFCENIFNDFIAKKHPDIVKHFSHSLAIDYNGFGFLQYAKISLSSDFGSENADEYISKALPMFSNPDLDLKDMRCIFWAGDIPDYLPNNSNIFYIIRIRTIFTIKPLQTPFVRYRENDNIRGNTADSENSDWMFKGWSILKTSMISTEDINFLKKHYIRPDSKYMTDFVYLTLGKDDYSLFLESMTYHP